MTAVSAERVRVLLAPVVEPVGIDLEDVTIKRAGRRNLIVITVDKDGGVDLDTVAQVSRAVSEALDESTVTGEAPYVLEVTSPGVDRPLTEPRHWRRAVGRLVDVVLTNGSSVVGRIVAADPASADIETAKGPVTVAYPEVAKAKIQVEFNRSSEVAAQPDADEEEV